METILWAYETSSRQFTVHHAPYCSNLSAAQNDTKRDADSQVSGHLQAERQVPNPLKEKWSAAAIGEEDRETCWVLFVEVRILKLWKPEGEGDSACIQPFQGRDIREEWNRWRGM